LRICIKSQKQTKYDDVYFHFDKNYFKKLSIANL
jgi:hypothetical protein